MNQLHNCKYYSQGLDGLVVVDSVVDDVEQPGERYVDLDFLVEHPFSQIIVVTAE